MSNTVQKYEIDYEYGEAEMWTPVPPDQAEKRFYDLANQCFGIRKSIGRVYVAHMGAESIPSPWGRFEGAYEMLTHHMDVIVWDANGEKIKSEWD